MYRLKYYSLTKKEKESLKKDFYNTDFGNEIKNRLDRLFIIGIISFIFSIYLFLTSKSIWNIVYSSILLIAGILFIISSFKVRINKLNNYLVKRKKK